MILHMDEELRKGNPITHKTLNRTLGYVISNKLASPGVSIHTRLLYKIVKSDAKEGVIIVQNIDIIAQLH